MIREAKAGFLGIGRDPATVRVTVKDPSADAAGGRQGTRRRRRRRGRGDGEASPQPAGAERESPDGAASGEGTAPQPAAAERPPRPSGRRRRGAPEGQASERRPRSRSRSGGGPRDHSPIRPADPEDEIAVPGAPGNPPTEIKSDPEDAIDLFGSTLRDLLLLLGLRETSISARDPETPGDGVGLIAQVFDVYGDTDEASDELAVLIGRRGETLNALQYLLNVLVSHHSDEESIFSIDIEGYRSRRERTLVDMALDIAAEVRETGDVITLEPMPAAERRIIHLTLDAEDGVTTESVGRGDDRQVEVMPE